MRYSIILIIYLIGLISNSVTGQTQFENDKLKFWQPDTKLNPKDFKADTSRSFNNLNRKFEMQAYSFCILKSILDVPRKKKERGKKLEKVYLAPCIDKYQSVSITTDSLEMTKQQMFFDITELFARKARQEFISLQDSMGHAYGIYWSMYTTVISDICVRRNKMMYEYMEEVIIYNKDGAYDKWRKLVDELLIKMNEYATKPEDCIRFLEGKL
jgi:hypothetical protein